MKLTPWMLTIATFGMVVFIAVSYLVKQSGAPPLTIADYGFGNARVSDTLGDRPKPRADSNGSMTTDPKETPGTQDHGTPDSGDTGTQVATVEDPPYQPTPDGPLKTDTTNRQAGHESPSTTAPDEPVDSMFDDARHPPFVTEQFRGFEHNSAVFSEGRRVGHRAAERRERIHN